MGLPNPNWKELKNCKITFTNDSYVAEFGTNTNWNIIKYFPVHDITITEEGIGRAGTGELENGWLNDVCGFYLDIPKNILLSETDIIVDYEYTTNAKNKNGVGFTGIAIVGGGTGCIG